MAAWVNEFCLLVLMLNLTRKRNSYPDAAMHVISSVYRRSIIYLFFRPWLYRMYRIVFWYRLKKGFIVVFQGPYFFVFFLSPSIMSTYNYYIYGSIFFKECSCRSELKGQFKWDPEKPGTSETLSSSLLNKSECCNIDFFFANEQEEPAIPISAFINIAHARQACGEIQTRF